MDAVRTSSDREGRIIMSPGANLTFFEGVGQELQFWAVKVQDIVNTTADKSKATAKELEESFAGRGDTVYHGPPVHPPLRPADADPIDMVLDGPPQPGETSEGRSVPPGLRFQVLQRDNFTCRYCGRRAPEVVLEVDHAVAWAAGGETDINNLITTCRDCNRGKSVSSVDPATTKKRPF